MKISDGVHFINAVAIDPRKNSQSDCHTIRQFDIIEISRFKLKQIESKIVEKKTHNYIALREWPRLVQMST